MCWFEFTHICSMAELIQWGKILTKPHHYTWKTNLKTLDVLGAWCVRLRTDYKQHISRSLNAIQWVVLQRSQTKCVTALASKQSNPILPLCAITPEFTLRIHAGWNALLRYSSEYKLLLCESWMLSLSHYRTHFTRFRYKKSQPPMLLAMYYYTNIISAAKWHWWIS